ncbi:unnamed protein product, partial [Mesorhabditis belari]|uniref:Uncharacterized protein n=1 Tax=Mesorhabditis belari TaxID=2138241 RepID=A0AAF3EU71_9BILA
MRHLIALGCLLLASVLAEDLTENAQKTLTALRELKGKEYELLKGLNEDERIDVEDLLEKDAEEHDNAELEAIEAEIKTNNQEITATDASSEEETGDAERKVVRVKRSLRARRRRNRQRRNRQLRRQRQGLRRKLRKLRRRTIRKFHGRRRAANRRRHHPRGSI